MLVEIVKPFPTTPFDFIKLQNGMCVLFDPKWLKVLKIFHWYAKKSRGRFYACARLKYGHKVSFIRMHRCINRTPKDQICHHINGNTLDNRSANLRNMSRFEHAKLYSYW